MKTLMHGPLLYDKESGIGHLDKRRLIEEIIFPDGRVQVKISVLPTEGDSLVCLGAHYHEGMYDTQERTIFGEEEFTLTDGSGILLTQLVDVLGQLVGERSQIEIKAPYGIIMPFGLAHTFYLAPGSVLYNKMQRKFDPEHTHAVDLTI